jgi:hypothetical protein
MTIIKNLSVNQAQTILNTTRIKTDPRPLTPQTVHMAEVSIAHWGQKRGRILGCRVLNLVLITNITLIIYISHIINK